MNIDEVVELRVHGVSGTPPEDLLDRQLVELMEGDATAGFYRASLAAERRDSFPKGAISPMITGPTLEGYAWGGLTSGSPARAFWLVLLPLSLINVAPRLRPGDPAAPGSDAAKLRVRLIWYVCRLLALALTVVLVMAFIGVGMDLMAWQCGSDVGRCSSAAPGWLFDPILRRDLGIRIAIGAAVPALGLGALWYLSGRTIKRYEQVTTTRAGIGQPSADQDDDSDAVETRLDSRWMWDNEQAVRRLRAIHVQTGFAVTVAFASAPLTPGFRWPGVAVAITIIAYAVGVLWVPSYTGHRFVRRWRHISYCIWGVLAIVGTVMILRLCGSATVDASYAQCDLDGHCLPHGGLPGFGGTVTWILFVELILLLALLVVVLLARADVDTTPTFGAPGPSPGAGGMGCWVMALMAVFLAAVFTAGAYLFGAAWLSTGSVRPSLEAVSGVSQVFAVPEAILDAAFAYTLAVGFGVIVLLGFGVLIVITTLAVNVHSWLIVPNSFPTDYGPGGLASARSVAARRKTVLRAMFVGRLVDTASTVLVVLMVAGAVLTYVFGVILALEWCGLDGPARYLLGRSGPGADSMTPAWFSATSLQGKGAYLVIWSLILLVGLGAAAFRMRPTRRSVGILWDLASFWPRVSHPLAPPCYAERTVPDLITRICWHTGSGRGVVLAAHSQGTVIGAAALLRLRMIDSDDAAAVAPSLPRVGLLTFGCVLRRLYGRFFPVYFGPASLATLHEALADGGGEAHRWRNLWRYTDYLGGPVMSGPPPEVAAAWTVDSGGDPAAEQSGPVKVDAHLRDPEFAIRPGGTVYPSPGRHSDFSKVPEFQAAVTFLADRI